MKKSQAIIWTCPLVVFLALLSLHISLVGSADSAPFVMASTNISGHIATNTTWTLVGSPYIVAGGVIVDNSAFLTIEPGVVVRFTAGTNLVIDGGLIVQGNATHKITFTSNATSPAPGDWLGILIHSSGYCNATNSVIEYAATGIHFESHVGERHRIFDHSRVASNIVGMKVSGIWWNVYSNGLTIESNLDCGIHIVNGLLTIENSLISNNNVGVDVRGDGSLAYLSLVNSTISHNMLDGILGSPDYMISMQDSEIINNGGRGINGDGVWLELNNSRISNNLGGGIYGSFYQELSVTHCNITNNNGDGVSSLYGVTLSGSIISNNTNIGVSASSVNIESSSITDNGDIGIISNGGDIHFSNLYNNDGSYEVQCNGSEHINATYNWWGTTNETVINERIYDYFDDSSVNEVSYVPFLNSPRATLTIFTGGVSSDNSVWVEKDGIRVGLVHDGKPLNITVYSGYTQSRMGTFSLAIEDTRIWDTNPNARYKFVNWTGPAGSDASNSTTLTVTANTSIVAFYKTQCLTNFTFKDSSGTNILYVKPSQAQLISPDSSQITLASFQNEWLDQGTWTVKQILWQGNNVKPAVDPTYTPIAGGTWIINCRVYTVDFSDTFKDSIGTALNVNPSSFKLTFPNGTTSIPLNVETYFIQNGTTTWYSIIWQDSEVVSTPASTFDATNGNPATNCRIYSLTVDPVFLDNAGTVPIYPSSWAIRFPNNTIRTVSSPVTYGRTQTGGYSIVDVVWKGVNVVPATTPAMLLDSDILWSPSINCILPTSLPLSLSSSTSYVGFKIEINGNLTCNDVGLGGAPILLSYSVTHGESWGDITLANTTSDGSYSVEWMLPATGSYLVRATWSGNVTYPGATTVINLAVIPFREQNVFSVTSNSTVSELTFNSTSRELSFVVTGPSGTNGYVNVCIAKTLIDNITDVKVYLDNNQLNYVVTSEDDSWLLHFTYIHSAHRIAIDLGLAPFVPPQLITPLGIGISALVLAIAAVLVISKIRRGTPPTILDSAFREPKQAQSLLKGFSPVTPMESCGIPLRIYWISNPFPRRQFISNQGMKFEGK